MNDRAGFFAACADTLTSMCAYYVAAGILIMHERGWGLHLFWLLATALACSFLFTALLKKPRSTPFLTAATGILFAACMAVYLLASATPARFGYGFVLAVGAGMAVGLPLYYCLHRPEMMRHLTHLDVLLIALLGLLLTREALGIDGGTVALMVAVLLMDAAAAVGLRMSDGETDSAAAFRASMTALVCAAALALVIALLSVLFSRSGGVTGGVLRGIGAFFAAIGGGIERFFLWLSGLIRPKQTFDTIELDTAPPSVAEAELSGQGMALSMNATAVGAALCVLAVAAAVTVTVVLRRRRFTRDARSFSVSHDASVRRTGGTFDMLWRRLTAALRFRYTAFRRRDTAAGVLVYLERRSARRHMPRGGGETMRAFIGRVDPGGGLDALADALDREYYGGEDGLLGAKRCRELRKYIRRVVQHG